MIWQEAVFAVGSLLFSVALLPTLRAPSKPALSTSLMTGSILLVFAFAYATLDLWYAAATGSVTAGIWLTLAWQAR